MSCKFIDLCLLSCLSPLSGAREASQIFGGLSYTRGGQGEKVERLYREVRGFAIPASAHTSTHTHTHIHTQSAEVSRLPFAANSHSHLHSSSDVVYGMHTVAVRRSCWTWASDKQPRATNSSSVCQANFENCVEKLFS